MVHNGMIWNDDLVEKEQVKSGIKYVSRQPNNTVNDSEVLMYDLADVIEGRKENLTAEGSIAFVMVQLDKNGKRKALYFGRNSGSPLKIKKYSHGFSLTSEGDGIMVEQDRLFKYNYATRKFSSEYMYIPEYTVYSKSKSYGGSWEHEYELRDSETYERNVYTGYDNKEYVLPTGSTSSTFTEQALERTMNKGKYSCDYTELDEADAVSTVQQALLYDMNFCNNEAIEFGYYLYDEMKQLLDTLEEIIEADKDFTGHQLNNFIDTEEKMRLLQLALNKMCDRQMKLAITEGLRGKDI